MIVGGESRGEQDPRALSTAVDGGWRPLTGVPASAEAAERRKGQACLAALRSYRRLTATERLYTVVPASQSEPAG
jgi:hypothetical protein